MVEDDPSLADESEAVFSVLGDETRLAILLELAGRSDPDRATRPVSFSELRRAVGVDDAGRFNYHLDQLQDTFVAKDDDGYRATVAGLEVASSIHAGRYAGTAEDRSADTEYDCPACGGVLEVSYADEMVALSCGNDHQWFSFPVPAGAAVNRSLEELLDVAVRRASVNIELARNDLCPRCWGRTSIELRPPDGSFAEVDWEVPRADVECDRCWLAYYLSGSLLVAGSPPVVAFYEEHGLDPEDAVLSEWNVMARSEPAIATESPLELEIALDLDGDRLVVAVAADGEILDYRRE